MPRKPKPCTTMVRRVVVESWWLWEKLMEVDLLLGPPPLEKLLTELRNMLWADLAAWAEEKGYATRYDSRAKNDPA